MSEDKTPRQLLASLYSGGVEFTRETFNTLAAALSASEGAAPVAGWVTVPVVPTPEMVRAIRFAGDPQAPPVGEPVVPHETAFPFVGEPVAARMYRSVIAVAPTTPQPAVNGDDQAEVIARLRDDVAMLRETLAAVTKQPAVNGAGLSDDMRRASLIANEAQRFADDRTHLGAMVYLNDLAWALRILAAPDAQARPWPMEVQPDGTTVAVDPADLPAQARPVALSHEQRRAELEPSIFANFKPPYAAPTAPPAEASDNRPVAEFADDFIFCLRKQPNGERWPVGTKLYTRPAAPLSASAEAAAPEPMSEGTAIRLWHENKEAHKRESAFEWFAAGILCAESWHGVVRAAAIAATSAGEGQV